jgi:hypothetical protein
MSLLFEETLDFMSENELEKFLIIFTKSNYI